MKNYLLLALFALTGCRSTATPRYYEIGPIQRSVSTTSAEAQLWFDRGLGHTYGFNHAEAIRCFERAAAADPDCAMAQWGIAYANGPNYNDPELAEAPSLAALAALERARQCTGASDVERQLIDALAKRYGDPASADRKALDAAYAAAMRELRSAHPDDADIAALTAESLMQLRPWELWSADGIPAPETHEIRTVLEESLARWPEHPALCHLYIHAMEAGPEVAAALPTAERLETLTPGLGHLVHMPSHIYTWTGRYSDMVRVNLDAIEADLAYVEYAGRNGFYTLYRLHNYHFVAYGGMFTGQRDLALEAARDIQGEVSDELLADFADYLDIFLATPYHVMVRFGMWEEILREPEPQGADRAAARAVWRYARGIALAVLGRVNEAQAELSAFRTAKSEVPDTRMLFQNSVADILRLAEKVLEGELEYRRGNHEQAFALLREAAKLDESLSYDEPWGWMEPARHALGALLTEQGRYTEALEVYRTNLARFPENGWALHGLAECLEGLGRQVEAIAVRTRFEAAWADADIAIPGSCFCRTEAGAP